MWDMILFGLSELSWLWMVIVPGIDCLYLLSYLLLALFSGLVLFSPNLWCIAYTLVISILENFYCYSAMTLVIRY